jgi:hypothetical protein
MNWGHNKAAVLEFGHDVTVHILAQISCPPQQEQGIFFWIREVNGFITVGMPVGFVVSTVI